MNYQDYDYGTESDVAPWAAAPTASSNQMIGARNGQVVPAHTHAPITVNSPAPQNPSELLVLGSMLQAIQQAQSQQTYLLRDFDARLARLENNTRAPAVAPTASFERGTWWAIWGLLMLILGGALAVVIVLILLNVQFR